MLFAVCVLAVLGAAILLARRRHGGRGLRFALFLSAVCIGLAGCARPIVTPWHAFVLVAAVLVALLAFAGPPGTSSTALSRRLSALGLVAAFGIVIPLGAAELLTVLAWKQGWIEIFEPTHIDLGPGLSPTAALVHRPGTEDWRLCHIVGDELRELDPVLFWRSVPKPPYNAQRFKGPLAILPKPPGLFRIIAYGDSNTDGPPGRIAWSECLAREIGARADLHGRPCEVLNAGVAGYSSYQGLLRARQEVPIYSPDLILVSFGWNDLPAAIGRPDKEFEPPSAVYVEVLELLSRSKLFLYLKHVAENPAPPQLVGPRVSPEDYAKNLESFLALSRQRGIGVAFLTRPHRSTEAEQRKLPGWRGNVPDYNEVVRAFAARTGAVLVDVERRFEGNESDFYDDAHFSDQGHEAMGSFLLEHLAASGLLDALHQR